MAKPVWEKPRPKKLGKPKKLSPEQKTSAKASAKAAGRPYPNMIDNMKAGRRKFADGGVVDVAAPPVGMTNLATAPTPTVQAGPYNDSSSYGAALDSNVGTGINNGLGIGQQGNLVAKNRTAGTIGTVSGTSTQGYAKGGLVTARGAGRARSKPCRMC